jgi:pyrimidine deaminase RibD-like protein
MEFSSEAKARFMAAALAESLKALPACRPNPPVGCVIVAGDRILSRGFTGVPGAPHAEASALASLSSTEGPAGLSVFVTLEPCAFQGRTPSCASALVTRGIRSVFVGIVDPDPRNNGRGLRLLMDAGIHVELGILDTEVNAFLASHLTGARSD